jgi:hypothetical protein
MENFQFSSNKREEKVIVGNLNFIAFMVQGFPNALLFHMKKKIFFNLKIKIKININSVYIGIQFIVIFMEIRSNLLFLFLNYLQLQIFL